MINDILKEPRDSSYFKKSTNIYEKLFFHLEDIDKIFKIHNDQNFMTDFIVYLMKVIFEMNNNNNFNNNNAIEKNEKNNNNSGSTYNLINLNTFGLKDNNNINTPKENFSINLNWREIFTSINHQNNNNKNKGINGYSLNNNSYGKNNNANNTNYMSSSLTKSQNICNNKKIYDNLELFYMNIEKVK